MATTPFSSTPPSYCMPGIIIVDNLYLNNFFLPLIMYVMKPFDGSQINELTRAQSTRADGKIKKPMHVAFGERIAVPTHLLKVSQ